jgi:hypothetical protein
MGDIMRLSNSGEMREKLSPGSGAHFVVFAIFAIPFLAYFAS